MPTFRGKVQTDIESTDYTIAGDWGFTGLTTAVTRAPADNSTLLATTAYVDTAVSVENLWNRDASGTPYLVPVNAGDDLNILEGDIYSIDPTNTSGTKSYQIIETMTGVVPSFEHAKVEFKGLWQGNEKVFMDFSGAGDSFNVFAQDWIYQNTQAGVVSVLEHKVDVSATGGSGWFFNRVTGKNNAAGDVIYYRDRAIIATNTAGSEDGIHVLDVMENGTITEYMRLDGGTQLVTTAKPLTVTGNIISSAGATDGLIQIDNASAVVKVDLRSNGISFLDGGNVGIGTTVPDVLFHSAEATDGDSIVGLFENSQANAAASTNETTQIRFGFGGDNDAARFVIGKEADYTSAANSDSFMAFYTDTDGTASEKMRISSAGSLLVGPTTSSSWLHVQKSTSIGGTVPITFENNQADSKLRLNLTSGTAADFWFESDDSAATLTLGESATTLMAFSSTTISLNQDTFYIGKTDEILYTDSSDQIQGVALATQDAPLLSNGTSAAPKFGGMKLGPAIISLAGATPVDSDFSTWNNDTFGIGVGTGGRVWSVFKNATDVYGVELTTF